MQIIIVPNNLATSDVEAIAQRIVAAGGSALAQPSVLPGALMFSDPWGTTLELVPAPVLKVHHVHLRAPDPAAAARWYSDMFGGRQVSLADHIGWRTPDLDQTIATLRAGATRMLSDIEPRGVTTRIIFVEGPAGTKIELLQR